VTTRKNKKNGGERNETTECLGNAIVMELKLGKLEIHQHLYNTPKEE